MIRALWSAATGMRAQQTNIDSIANDLTNVNTNGYKKRHVNFQDLFYQSVRSAGVQGGDANVPVGIEIGHGVKVGAIAPIFTQGGATETNITTNLMIVDGGNSARNFFSVTRPDGTVAYTRDGNFIKNNEGELTTSDGLRMNPPITGIPASATELTITAEGRVMYTPAQGQAPVELARIQLHTFQNPAGLQPIGLNLWMETPASGAVTTGNPGDAGFGSVQSGWLETSNVDAISEMVNMIAAQRSYEFNSRSIQASDEMLQTVNSLKR